LLKYGNLLIQDLRGVRKERVERWMERVKMVKEDHEMYDRKCFDCFSEISEDVPEGVRVETISRLLIRHIERVGHLKKFAWPCEEFPFKMDLVPLSFGQCMFGVDVKKEMTYHSRMITHYSSLIHKIRKEGDIKEVKGYGSAMEKLYELCRDCFEERFGISI
jgi:hypothetical protein